MLVWLPLEVNEIIYWRLFRKLIWFSYCIRVSTTYKIQKGIRVFQSIDGNLHKTLGFHKLTWYLYTENLGARALRFSTVVILMIYEVSKGAKIRNRYNPVPHLAQDTNGKVTNSQLYTTNESQEVSPFPAGDHKAQINRRTQRHNKHKTEKTIKDPQKKYRLGTVSKVFYGRAQTKY